jgi:hypothetical protein
MQTQEKIKKAVGFWQYVKQSPTDACEIDRDRAMEYIRCNTLNVNTFKLVMLGASIAFNQARKKDKDVLGFYADFVADDVYNTEGKPLGAVTIRAEIRREEVSPKAKDRSSFYEFTLLVNLDGKIVDVDYRKLQRQLAANQQPMRGY